MKIEGPFDDESTIRSSSTLGRRPNSSALWAARSSVGLRRSDQQDAWGERDGRRFVVADGVGGEDGGAIASATAVAEFLARGAEDDWQRSMTELDRTVQYQCSSRGVPNAATTLIGCDLVGFTATLIHIGDSRAYLLRGGGLSCLTVDHNLANLRRAEGVDPDTNDGRGKPRALTSFLGCGDAGLKIDVLETELAVGDRLLLCSDGIHEQLSTKAMARLLGTQPIADAAAGLVEAADAAGGRDNATAIVIAVEK